MDNNYTPRQIAEKLDQYIIGQQDAKRSVAVALRNRYRRMQLDDALKDEIVPKKELVITALLGLPTSLSAFSSGLNSWKVAPTFEELWTTCT